MNIRMLPIGLILLFLFLTGCAPAVDLTEPPEILYGEDVCAECGMIISDARFAAAIVTVDEQVRLFDDMGGMFAYVVKREEAVHAYWVHDLNSEDWIRAENAAYVLQQDLITPMGWGLTAFENSAAAEAYIEAAGGWMTTFEAVEDAVRSGVLDARMLHDHLNCSQDDHKSDEDDYADHNVHHQP